jgi:HEAT repeat protein
LTKLLGHKEPEIRIEAAGAISVMGPAASPAVPDLAKLLAQPDPRQRYLMAVALERLGQGARAALPALLVRLKDLEPVSPNPVLMTLGNLGPAAKDAVPALIEILKNKETTLHGDAIDVLGRIGPDAQAAVPKLMEFLFAESDRQRRDAARALGGIGPSAKAAVPALKKLLEDPRKPVRAWAGYALARILGDYKSGIALLTDLWKADAEDGDSFSNNPRHDIAFALDLLGAEARPARDLLLDALLSARTTPGMRRHVAQALGHLRDDADVIVPKVLELTQRKAEGQARIHNCVDAAHCLGLLGPRAKAAIPRLRQLADDEENEIVDAAALALSKIEAK